jgi:hypothetical protein
MHVPASSMNNEEQEQLAILTARIGQVLEEKCRVDVTSMHFNILLGGSIRR